MRSSEFDAILSKARKETREMIWRRAVAVAFVLITAALVVGSDRGRAVVSGLLMCYLAGAVITFGGLCALAVVCWMGGYRWPFEPEEDD